MKHTKVFENHSDYEQYINGGSGPVYKPNVSVCESQYEVHYNNGTSPSGDTGETYGTIVLGECDIFDAAGSVTNTVSLTTKETNTWEISQKSDWLYIEPMNGTGSIELELTADEYDDTEEDRVGYFTVRYTMPDAFYSVTKNNIVQEKLENKPYLTFVALEDGTFSFNGSTTANTLSYSLDDGATWTVLANNANTPTVTAGNKIMWRGTCTSSSGIGRFFSSNRFNIEGNIMSLIYGSDFDNQISLEGKSYVFQNLFSGNTNVVSVENMILPATTLSDYCYRRMFAGCTSLIDTPELPAITMTYSCYNNMFNGCTSLTTAPALPATTLDGYCYYCMFSGCTSLVSIPLNYLPATTLANSCYGGMFGGCTSLTQAPELPATSLTNLCYQNMFAGCTSLTTAPELPATILVDSCYMNMFGYCSSLTTAPTLSATTLANQCYYGMFNNCSSLTTAPELPATTLASSCYQYMFRDCTNLNYIKCLAADVSIDRCTLAWVDGVASSGTFIKASDTTWTTGINGIPTNWNVQDNV